MSDDTIVIVATSGRMLAQSARLAGLIPLVIDLFADQDTRHAAADVSVVENFAKPALLPVIDRLIKQYDVSNVVYGSGLENYPESLDLLAEKLNLLGNAPIIFQQLLDKKLFFNTLKQLHIPFPQVLFQSPEKDNLSSVSVLSIAQIEQKNSKDITDNSGHQKAIEKDCWLRKPRASQGGMGIQCLVAASSSEEGQSESPAEYADENYYWQRYIAGEPMSVLFLAAGQRVNIIGFNQQWTQPESFVFAGIINQANIPESKKKQLEIWIVLLVRKFGLTGMNSLDFIWDGDSCWVLEINPRPSASMVLYDTDFTAGLLNEHINYNRCTGDISPRMQTTVMAYQLVYAEAELTVPAGINWPHWSQDRPAANALISKHSPICSIIASGNNSQEVYARLRTRQQIMINKLYR